MMNVLVTGSNGQLASCIKDLAKQYEELNFIYTDYQELDICDLKHVEEFFKRIQKLIIVSIVQLIQLLIKQRQTSKKRLKSMRQAPKI